LWAIQQNIVCDYKIHVLKTPEEKLDLLFEDTYRKSVDILSETEKRLFLSAISAVNALNDCKKVLIYTNSKENSDRLIRFVADLLTSMRMNTFYSVYNSKLSGQEQKKILDKFESAEYAIISCVYCLGEGYDFPKLDGVIFAENMTSNIRIVQSALRPCRKDKDRPEKIARLYLPIVDKDDFLDNSQNSDLQKIRTLIHEMGLEDGDICEKVSYHEMVINYEDNYNSDSEIDNEAGKRKYKLRTSIIEMDPRVCEIIKFKIFNRESLGIMTYENAKKYLLDKKCKTRQEYVEKFRNNSRLSMDPESFYGSIFNWKDYLSIPEDTYYNKSECMEKIHHYSHLFNCNFYTDYSKVCDLLHARDIKFPPCDMWLNFYEIKQFDDMFLSRTTEEESMII
jgi:predicted helicase